MKKNELIAKLQDLPGNPTIQLWNGFVDDAVPIGEVQEIELHKIKFKAWLNLCELQAKRPYSPEEIAEMRKRYKKMNWTPPSHYGMPEECQKMYHTKRILVIDAKLTGRTCHDRLGKIEY